MNWESTKYHGMVHIEPGHASKSFMELTWNLCCFIFYV